MKTKIDSLGRIYFPRKWRENGFPCCGDYVSIRLDRKEGKIILEKAYPSCLSCKGKDHLVEISEGIFLCAKCARKKFSDIL